MLRAMVSLMLRQDFDIVLASLRQMQNNIEQGRWGIEDETGLDSETDQIKYIANLCENINAGPIGVEHYACIAISLQHISEATREYLHSISAPATDREMERKRGFFIKLADNIDYSIHIDMPDELKEIIRTLHSMNYRMIELDLDAEPCTFIKSWHEE